MRCNESNACDPNAGMGNIYACVLHTMNEREFRALPYSCIHMSHILSISVHACLINSSLGFCRQAAKLSIR